MEEKESALKKPIEMSEFSELWQKVDDRIKGRNLHGEKPDLSAYELDRISRQFFEGYYNSLCKAVADDVKKMNKRITKSNFFSRRVPHIASITPAVYENGDEELIVAFEDDYRYKGIAAIKRDKSIVFEFLHPAYSIGHTIDFLKNYEANFENYFASLDSFKKEYPNFAFEFGPSASEENSVQRLEDGFIEVKLDLNRPEAQKASLKDSRDAFVSSERCPGYEGYIQEEVHQFNGSILKNYPVHEEDLNPFFKRLLAKSRNEEPGPKRTMSIQ